MFLNQRKKGVDAGLKSDLKNAATAAESFVTDNPTSTTALTAANLTTGGFQATTGNTVQVKGTAAAGYCIRASNAGATSATGGTNFWYYDSLAGGLSASTTAPTGGACAVTGTFA